MTAKKAYELLKQRYVEDVAHPRTDLFIAHRIAFESLDLNLKMRHSHHHFDLLKLPSEEPE